MGKRQRKRQDESRKTRGWRDLILALTVALCSVYLIACTVPKKGIIIDNVYVNHVNVSGMTREEAASHIREDYEKSFAYQTLTVMAAGNRYTVKINKSLDFDSQAAAKEAYNFAHGFFLTRGYGVLKAAIFKQRFSRNPHIEDVTALKQAVEESGLLEVDTTTQTTYSIVGENLVFSKGAVGESVDETALIKKLKEAVVNEDYVSLIESPMVKGTVKETNMEEVYKALHTEKKDATLDSAKNYKVIPSVDGIDFNIQEAARIFADAKGGENAVVPVKVDHADISTEELREHLFKDVLGECSTELSGGENRIGNIEIAAEKINGTIVLAGDTFSFNKCVGERNRKEGYESAHSYFNGRGEAEIGGGISQVASTLYKSAMLSDLKIDERESMEYVPDFIDMGMDANIAWGGPDLVFSNTSRYPIKINAECDNGMLKVRVIGGRQEEKQVEITLKILRVIEHGTRYKETRQMLRGTSAVVVSGQDGYEVQTYRKIRDKKGKVISKKKEAYSLYKSTDTVIAEGTARPKPKPKPKQKENTKPENNGKTSTP